ncbi:MAG: biotin/lipoyl-binding protein [Bacteroidetes bacterium]|nr:biotin/lipoyl-binding protein [Bacteroidota bacterium]MBU1717635.1 biotin/lipoyl-binding protein [Bacteroidota bacterium]
MKRKIQFSLIYRDMWQSSGKYVPRVDQLTRIAPAIIDMGCFARIETNGGAFEQVNLLFGENPNKAVREWVAPFNQAGIQTHMLERALNGIRMFPVPADVRRLMYKVKKAQGVDIARSFCGLNDHRNLELSIRYAKDAGMISQAALSITHSELHTVEYFMSVVDKAVEYGADEIALKDMAGVGRPKTLGKLVYAIKQRHPNIKVQYHGHSGPGFSVASALEVAEAGADYIDVAMEPLSWGMVHPDVLTIQQMLKDADFDVPSVNMKAYMEARALTQEFIDDFLGFFIDSKNRFTSSLMIECGLPGGMMGSLMADLKGVHQGINMALKAAGQSELTEDELLIKLFDEVAYIWPLMGYPPLVTPFSQYVKNTALVNVLNLAQGKERFEMIDDNSWDMLLGKAGNLPGKIDPVFEKLASEQGREFYTGVPQEAYPDVLEKYRSEMEANGWETGRDDEELFEFAMHETQYRDYKSGIAKKRFEEEIAKLKTPKKSVAVNEKQAPNRSNYSKKEPAPETAMIAFLLYTLNAGNLNKAKPISNEPDVWSRIGYWRSAKTIHVNYEQADVKVIFENTRELEYEFTINGTSCTASLLNIETGEADVRINDDGFLAKISKGDGGLSRVTINGKSFDMKRNDLLPGGMAVSGSDGASDADANSVKSPMPGKVFKLNVKEGDTVAKGDVLLVVESMKMENRIVSTRDAVIKKVNVALNDMIEAAATLIVLE